MLYKNNAYMSEQKQKYALRKLPIGVASVLLGTVAVGMGTVQTAHADTTTDNTASQQVAENKVGGEKLTDKLANSQPTTNNTPQDKDISTTNTLNVNQTNNNQKAVQNNVQNTAATLADNKVAATNNNQQQVNQAKIDDFNWVMQGAKDGVQDQTVQNSQRFGFNAKITLSADQVNHAQTIHLFRMNQISNNKDANSFGGMTTYSPENSGSSLYYQGQYLGNITATPHYINKTYWGWQIPDYIDYYLNISNPIKNAIGEQQISINDQWTGTFNYVSPYSFRGIKSSSLTFNFAGNGLNKNYNVNYTWDKVNQNIISNSNPAMSKSSVSSVPGTTLADGGHSTHYAGLAYPGWNNKAEVDKYNSNGGKAGTIDINSNLKFASRNYTTNGNKLILDMTIGQEKPLSLKNNQYPISDLNGDIYQHIDPEIISYDLPYKCKRVDDNMTFQQLKDLNYTGVVVSQQSDGSILEYANIPVKSMALPQNLNDLVNHSLLERSFLINYLAKNDDQANQMAKNTLNNIHNGALQGLPALGLLFDYDYHLNDSQEKTTVKSDTLAPDTGNVIQTNDQTNYQNSFAKQGQAQVNIHYISGANGVELSKTSQNIGDNNTDVKFNIPSVDTYHVRTGKDGQNTVTLLNGKTMTLPDGGTTISNNQGLKYPAESTVKDYYVVLDPASANETYQFVDDNNNGAKVGTPTVVNGYLNETKPLSLAIPAGYALAKGQTIPANATLQNKTVLIHLVHKTTSVSRDVTVKRTVNYLEKGTNKELAKPVVQELTFKQVGVKDEATGATTWLTGDEEQSFDEVKSPEVDGYEAPSQASVESVKVKSDAKDQVVNVYYTKKATPAKPKAEVTNNQNHTPSAKVDKTKVTLPSNTSSALQPAPINTTNSSIVLPAKNNNNLAQTNTGANKNGTAIMGLALVGGTLILGSVKKRED